VKKTASLLACLILICLPAAVFGAEKVVEKTFQVSPDARLSVEFHKGKIAVRTANVSEIRMTARIHPDEGPDEDLDLVEIDTSSSSGYVRVKVDYDQVQRKRSGGLFDSWNGTSLPLVDFDIVMPDGGRLDVETHKGRVDVEAPSGEVTVESHKGEGRITNVRGDFELSTHKGDFDVEIAEMKDVQVETHKGHVDLKIRGASDFTVRGQSHDGSITFAGYDIPVERDSDRHRHDLWISHTEGSGANRLELDTHKGDIRVELVR